MNQQVDEPIPVCEHCGVEMQPYVPEEDEAPIDVDAPGGMTIPAAWRCENHNCPGLDSDLAPAAPGQ